MDALQLEVAELKLKERQQAREPMRDKEQPGRSFPVSLGAAGTPGWVPPTNPALQNWPRTGRLHGMAPKHPGCVGGVHFSSNERASMTLGGQISKRRQGLRPSALFGSGNPGQLLTAPSLLKP